MPAPHATSRRITEYLKGLVDRYQVVVLSVKTPDHSHIERYHGARLLRVPVGSGDLRSRMESFDRAVRRQLESEEYLLVHFFDPVSGYPLCERRGDFGYKLVYGAYRFPSSDLPSLLPGEGANKRLLARSRRQELFCLMNADAVVVGSEEARTHCLGLGVPEANVNVVRAPVDLAPFLPDVMGKPDGTPTRLIHLGSHGKHQDLPLLLEALAKTKAAVKLALVGPSSPELTPALKERAAELKLTERVEFQEPVVHDDLHKVLAAADVGVLTLTDEPRNRAMTPLARIGEFLAAGRPIIAADLPLTRELVPAAAARFYTPGNVDSLAEAIDALASDPALRCTMGAAARTATSAIDSQAVCEQLIALYRRVAPGAAVPADAHVDDVDPSDATQLGAPAPDELTQAVKRAPESDSQKVDVGTNKVKTDPAALALPPEADTGTDQAVARGRPPVMGVLLRDDAPPVPVETTDPAVMPSREAPVVMGLPINDRLPDVDAVEPPPPKEPPPVAEEEALAPVAVAVPVPTEPAPAPAQPPEAPPSPAPALAAVPPSTPGPAPISTPGTTLNASDDEPLDFVAMLRPSAPVRSSSSVTIPSPDITAPNPPPVPRAPAPIPIAVPTSFSLAANRAGAPPGATFVPVPFGGVPVSTVPARVTTVPLTSAGVSAPSGVRPSAPPLPSSPSSLQPSPPPLFGGQGASPSGVRPAPLTAPAEAPGSTTSGVRAPPAVSGPVPPPGSTTSGVRVPPAVSSPGASALPAPGVASTPSTVRPAAPDALPPMVRLVPNPSPGGPPLLTKEAAETHDEVVEVHEDEVELVNDESFLSMHDGDEHDEIDEGELHALETSAAPPPSSLDPWFAQLVHGYCPPESQLFTRHVPPTTMPGRDT
ncbi:MAG: glycosyltransferase [Myxococcales bacterium]|nr:glycosyltransferase [Myxococcales bacterium]